MNKWLSCLSTLVPTIYTSVHTTHTVLSMAAPLHLLFSVVSGDLPFWMRKPRIWTSLLLSKKRVRNYNYGCKSLKIEWGISFQQHSLRCHIFLFMWRIVTSCRAKVFKNCFCWFLLDFYHSFGGCSLEAPAFLPLIFWRIF